MKLGIFIVASILIVSILISIGTLINVNDPNSNNDYSEDFRGLFGGVDKELIINPAETYNSFSNITILSASSSEDGTFEEYKVASKVDTTQVSIWEQYKVIIINFFSFSGLYSLQSLLLTLISIGLVIGSIEFIRRYKL